MRKNSLFSQFAIIGTGAIINMFLGLITTPIITRMADPEQYGQASMMTTYASIALMIFSLGLDQSLLRYFYSEDNKKNKIKLLYYCVIPPLAFSGIVLLGLAFFKRFINIYPFDNYYIYFAIYSVVLIINRFAVLLLRLEKKSRLYSIVNILHKALYVGIAILTIFLFHTDKAKLLIIANIIASFAAAVIAVFGVRQMWKTKSVDDSSFNISFKELIKYGFPMMIANGIYILFQAIDKISLSYFCSYAEVGVYSSAMSLLSIIAILRTTFNTVWVPASVERYEKNPDEKEYFTKANQYITVIMFLFGLTLILCKDIIVLLLGQKYHDAVYVMPFLLLQPIMYTISETTVIGIYFKKKSYATLIISAVCCLTNLVGNFILIPLVGPRGAAISTGLSYIVFFCLRTAFSNKYYPVDYSLKRFFLITVLTVGFCAYNSFIEFSLVTVLLYLVVVSTIILLYRKSMKGLLIIVRDYIKQLISRFKRK